MTEDERRYPPIEAIVLSRGWRGMDRLARHLPSDYLGQAAAALWARRARVLITTGFYVNGHPETDGPPGAFFLGRALAQGGAAVAFAADPEPLALLAALAGDGGWGPGGGGGRGPGVGGQGSKVDNSVPTPNPPPPTPMDPPQFIEFPITGAEESRARAEQIVAEWQPTAVVAIERCGRTAAGRYLNMREGDITPWTAQVDDLLAAPGALTIGIGDGGNEIGMGTLAAQIRAELGRADPALTPAAHLIVATTSNWGAYGLVAYLSRHAGRDLLPTTAEERAALHLLDANGAVSAGDLPPPHVDGYSLDIDCAVLEALRGAIGG
jgi:hypothetical protein